VPRESGEPPAASSADVQEHVTAYWNGRAGPYDRHPLSRVHARQARSAWEAILTEALPAPPVDVLDVGTGTGFLALVMAGLGHRVTGIDLATDMLAVAREKAVGLATPPVLRAGDAVDPPFPAGSFDAVTCRYLLWTLREPARALAAWRALLRPGGRLVAIDGIWRPNGWEPDGSRDPADWAIFIDHYSPEVRRGLPLAEAVTFDPFVAVVEAAGFVDVRLTPLHAIQQLQRTHAGTAGDSAQVPHLIRATAP
jgi:SAM-dependent methyltransferase